MAMSQGTKRPDTENSSLQRKGVRADESTGNDAKFDYTKDKSFR